MKFFTKPTSLTSNDFIAYLKKEENINKKACYCGRLDPMARGKMLILEGNECKEMDNYLNKDKIYEFIIVYGMSTDTDDIMGLFENQNEFSLLKQNIKYNNEIKNAIKKVQTKENQKYHKYSSYVLRKEEKRYPLWKWIKLGKLKENEIPQKKVKIYNIEEKIKYNSDLKDLLIHWRELIGKVNIRHNFRQKEIIKQYTNLIEEVEKKNNEENNEENMKVLCIKYQIKVSSGFYVRQFISDLKNEIKFPLLVFDINRIYI